jgi:hypothetical protein
VRGTFALELVDGRLVATPSFPDLAIKLQVEPSPQTWAALDRVLGQRSLGCRAALKLVDVPGLVRRLLDRGFTVKVPSTIFRPLRLPVGLRREVKVGERTHLVQMIPRRVSLTPQIAWLSADLGEPPRE